MYYPTLLWEVGNVLFGLEGGFRNSLRVTRAHALVADESCPYSYRTCSGYQTEIRV